MAPPIKSTAKVAQKIVAAVGSSSAPLASALWNMKITARSQTAQPTHSYHGPAGDFNLVCVLRHCYASDTGL